MDDAAARGSAAEASGGCKAGGGWGWRWRLRGGWSLVLWVGLALAMGYGAMAAERFPPPEFESGYTFPATTEPGPRAGWMEGIDLGLFVLALAASVYVVYWRRSRAWILGLALVSLAYFGFYRKGCICAVGSIQNVALALGDSSYALPWTVLGFFLLPLLLALVCGRTFCAGVCPLGAIQDVVLVRPLRVKPWLEKALGMLPFVYLGAAVLFAATGSAFVICEYDPFVSFFRRSGTWDKLALGAVFLGAGIWLGRPYCRFLCPYGALLRVASFFSRWKVTLTPEDCNQCRICEVACPFGAIEPPTAEAGPGVAAGGGRGRVAAWVGVALLLVLAGGWLGWRSSAALSRAHRIVRLAETVAMQETGLAPMDTEPAVVMPPTGVVLRNEDTPVLALRAFRQGGQPAAELVAEAMRIQSKFRIGGMAVGGLVGLVFGVQLIALAWPPAPRPAYDPDPAGCVACGRCYTYCPKEMVRVMRIQRKGSGPKAPG